MRPVSEFGFATIEEYQRFHGLLCDGVCGPVTSRHMELPRFCGYEDRMAARAELRAFPRGKEIGVVNRDAFPGFSMSETNQITEAIIHEWNKLSAFTAFMVANGKTADIRVETHVARIDGRGQVLAWSELANQPVTNQRYETVEPWKYGGMGTPVPYPNIDIGLTGLHEFGHAWGIEHAPGQDHVLSPIYTPRNSKLGPWEKNQMVTRYGERTAPPPTDPEMELSEVRIIVPTANVKVVPV